MAKFSASAPHQLGREQALERLRSFIDKVQELYGEQVSKLDSEWVDDVLKFDVTTFGFTFTGELSVQEDQATIDGKIPLAAVPFRGRIEKQIGEALEKALA